MWKLQPPSRARPPGQTMTKGCLPFPFPPPNCLPLALPLSPLKDPLQFPNPSGAVELHNPRPPDGGAAVRRRQRGGAAKAALSCRPPRHAANLPVRNLQQVVRFRLGVWVAGLQEPPRSASPRWGAELLGAARASLSGRIRPGRAVALLLEEHLRGVRQDRAGTAPADGLFGRGHFGRDGWNASS